MLNSLSDVFAPVSADLRFLTIRDPRGKKFQRVQQVSKHLQKISKTYLIVREKNKQNDYYHFHALVKVDTPPTKNWFRKGVSFQLKKVGKPDKPLAVIPENTVITQRELHEMRSEGMEAEATEIRERQVLDRVMDTGLKSISRKKHVDRLLTYMGKEMKDPIQYIDYMYLLQGKNQLII